MVGGIDHVGCTTVRPLFLPTASTISSASQTPHNRFLYRWRKDRARVGKLDVLPLMFFKILSFFLL